MNASVAPSLCPPHSILMSLGVKRVNLASGSTTMALGLGVGSYLTLPPAVLKVIINRLKSNVR